MNFLRDDGHNEPHEATNRICTPLAAQFLLDTNERLENINIARNSFKTNNSANFYSIQTANSTRYKSTPRRAAEISIYKPAATTCVRGLANLTLSSLSSDLIFDDRNPRA
jgi:hypothetical protein